MPKYTGFQNYEHESIPSAGVLLTNLGTPDHPTPDAVRKYLAEFLSDPRVIEVHPLIWLPVLHGIILRTRPRRSALAYKKVWTNNGSPLLDISLRQLDAVKAGIAKLAGGPVRIELAMRYGNPSISDGLEKLRAANVQRLLVFPLYPQYSATTTASTFDAVTDVLKTWRWVPAVRMLNNYHDDPGYIDALVNSIRDHWTGKGTAEKLLFSFHGLPKHYFLAGDPYFCQCHKTARLVAEGLGLNDDKWLVSFQSRFGPREWLKPYTDKTLVEWGKHGVKSVDVICPGFSADCLETLEEIQIQNRDFFLEAGGERFSYIPALNDRPGHITALAELIINNCRGWPEFDPDRDEVAAREETRLSRQRYQKMRGPE